MERVITVAISCIGSGIGQAVINSIRLSSLRIRTIGIGNNAFAYGALDCDVKEYVPSIYDTDYVDILLEKCFKYSVDLIIPGIDDDVLILSENENRFNEHGIKV